MNDKLTGMHPEMAAFADSLNVGHISSLGFNINAKGCELWVVTAPPESEYKVLKRKRLDHSTPRETFMALLGQGICGIAMQVDCDTLATATMTTEISLEDFQRIRAFFEAQENIDE